MREQRHLAIARARDRFVETGMITGSVRPGTARSWRRSALAGLTPDRVLRPGFGGAAHEGGALIRATRPVAEQLVEEFADASVAMLLADREGRILGRWAGTRVLAELDEICARPGYIFDEQSVGTSALGTAIEDGAPVVVVGPEHFVSTFDGLCAAGAPIRHPVTGRTEGVIDIVCSVAASETFMLPLITRAAREVQDRLLRGHTAADRALLDGMLFLDRRGPRRPTVALNSRIMITNVLAGDLLPSGGDRHSELWTRIEQAIRDGGSTVVLEPDEGSGALVGAVRAIGAPDGSAGAVLHLHRKEPGRRASRVPPAEDRCTEPAGPPHLLLRARVSGGTLSHLQRAERAALQAALGAAHGNKRNAAEALGISRSTLYRKMAALRLDP